MTSAGFTWADFYLICFAIGFCFSFISFVFGTARTGRLHLPHVHGPAVPHAPLGHAPVAHGPVGHGTPGAHGGAHHASAGGHGSATSDSSATNQFVHSTVSPFNPPTIAAFLAWFGGTGYLLTRFSTLWVGLELGLSMVAGTIGGGIIFLFLSRVLMSDQEYMNAADYEMVGVLGKLCVSIRDGGTGELLYSQMGTRRVCGARSEDGVAIPKGTEVVVTRYERGIAYVRLWSELAGEE